MNEKIFDAFVMRIAQLKEELVQITNRRDEGIKIMEKYREEIRNLKTKIKELKNG